MAYGVSHGHMTDDVTWPPKVLDSLASCSSMVGILLTLTRNTASLYFLAKTVAEPFG